MQSIILSGYIVGNTEKVKNNYMYFAGSEAEKKASMLLLRLSVQRPFARKDENGYYPHDFIPMKAFGVTADFINKYFQPGDPITITGHFSTDRGGEKPDGTKYPDRLMVQVDTAEFCLGNGKKKEENASSAPATQAPAQSATRKNPFPF